MEATSVASFVFMEPAIGFQLNIVVSFLFLNEKKVIPIAIAKNHEES
jgi:hypothetical protein